MPLNAEKREADKDLLKHYCGDLIVSALADPSVIEIMLNPDGKLWIEKLGKSSENIGEIAEINARSILEVTATYHGRVVNEDNSILECTFPLEESRFEGVFPPNASRASFALRKKASQVFPLQNYVTEKIPKFWKELKKTASSKKNIDEENAAEIIENAILSKKNILVVGGTSSGKTTLLNAIIDGMYRLCPHDRIITMEDVAELQVQALNKFQMFTSKDVSMTHLLKATMRLRPDRILVGEVRDGAALSLLKAWNTGHPGGCATIHANSAYSGLTRMVGLVGENQDAPRMIEPLVAEAVDIVIFINKENVHYPPLPKEIRSPEQFAVWQKEKNFTMPEPRTERIISEIISVEDWDQKQQRFKTTPLFTAFS